MSWWIVQVCLLSTALTAAGARYLVSFAAALARVLSAKACWCPLGDQTLWHYADHLFYLCSSLAHLTSRAASSLLNSRGNRTNGRFQLLSGFSVRVLS